MVPVLAYADKGSFENKPISELPGGVNHWMQSNHEYIVDLRSGKTEVSKTESIAIRAMWSEFNAKSELTKGNYAVLNTIPSCGEANIGDYYWMHEVFGPLTTTTWGQGVYPAGNVSGYNYYMSSSSCGASQNNKKLVGCVGVSIAQIMYYHQYPNGFSWSSMALDSGSMATSALMGAAANAVNTNFGCNSSSAYISDTDNAFKNTFGYSNAIYANFNLMTVYNNIRFGYPVILGANRSLFVGHQWVCDGIQWDEYFQCTQLEDTPNKNPNENKLIPPPIQYQWVSSYSAQYLSMNWGWNGGSNGWFSAYVWAVGGYHYQYDMEMVTGIQP